MPVYTVTAPIPAHLVSSEKVNSGSGLKAGTITPTTGMQLCSAITQEAGLAWGESSSVTHGIEGDTLAAGYYENAGVYGYSTYSRTFGVLGESEFGIGIEGRLTNTENTNGAVVGYNTGGGNGVEGYSTNNYGVYAEGGLYGVATPDGMLAPSFDVGSPDLAEFFPATGPEVTAGTVVVIDVGADGSFVLKLSTQPYDTAAAGIISTEPGITLGIKDGIIIPGENDGKCP